VPYKYVARAPVAFYMPVNNDVNGEKPDESIVQRSKGAGIFVTNRLQLKWMGKRQRKDGAHGKTDRRKL
jgi:hypothetical protein